MIAKIRCGPLFGYWHFSDLANESSVGPLCGAKQTYSDYVFDFRV
jgi:hypothetical protein